MSDLTTFRDHCRTMAGSPVAPGCPAAADRALWTRLANEIDRYLEQGASETATAAAADHTEPLWETT